MKFDVVTFGSAVVDIFADTNVPEKNNSLCYPAGSKILLKNLKFDIGGGGTNTAVAFSRLGLKTGCICKVGKDSYGKSILELLKKEKIKFLGKIEKNNLTGYSIILDSKENNRTILTYKGINNEIKTNEIKTFKTKWIYCSSLLGESLETQKKLIKKLKKQNTKFAFNPSDYLIKEKNLKDLLKETDILILNKEEALILLKNNNLKLYEELKKLISKQGIVVITDKNKEILAFENSKKHKLKPNKIKVVERTGAGDAFASGFVAGQIAKKSIEESLKLGLKESESVIKHFGAKNKLIKMKLK